MITRIRVLLLATVFLVFWLGIFSGAWWVVSAHFSEIPEDLCRQMDKILDMERSILKTRDNLHKQFRDLALLVERAGGDASDKLKVMKELSLYLTIKQNLHETVQGDYLPAVRRAGELARNLEMEPEAINGYAVWSRGRTQFIIRFFADRLVSGFSPQEDEVLEQAFDIACPDTPNPVRRKKRETGVKLEV